MLNGMYDPSMRVLTVLELLQARERVTGPELSRWLEVSPRTVQRYVARLQDLGIPVESTRGVGGAYRLRPGFRLPPLMLTDDEAMAISLGLRALRHVGLGQGMPAAALAEAKLKRVLPKVLAARLHGIEEAVQMVPMPWTVPTDPGPLVVFASAVASGQVVGFSYRSRAGEETRRAVEPYGLVHLDGRWYVVGHCLTRQALRSFRLDRIHDAGPQPGHFERPADFDAHAYLRQTLPFVPLPYRIEVWLDLPLAVARHATPPWRTELCEHEGGTLLRGTREHLGEIAAMLLGLNCELRIISPPELRDTMRSLAERALRAASGDAPGPAVPAPVPT